jgi:hypothetical protein
MLVFLECGPLQHPNVARDLDLFCAGSELELASGVTHAFHVVRGRRGGADATHGPGYLVPGEYMWSTWS